VFLPRTSANNILSTRKIEHSLFTKQEAITMMQDIAQEGMIDEALDTEA
jgi:hypothetical protein